MQERSRRNKPDSTERIKFLRDNTCLEHIEPDLRNGMWKILSSYSDVFHLPEEKFPQIRLTEHRIELTNNGPINAKSYGPPEVHKHEVKKQVSEMFNKKIIQHSDSPYNAPLWVVPKKIDATGKQKWRIVINFRRLNERIIQDAYPLPVIEDILNHLENAKFFSAFGLSVGFHQIPMNKESRKYTAFSTPGGHFEYNRMPFGLKNAPAAFQGMMAQALR